MLRLYTHERFCSSLIPCPHKGLRYVSHRQIKHTFISTILSEGLSFSLFLSSSLAPSVAAAFPSPPTLSLPLPLSRVGLGDNRAPVPQAVVKPQVLTHLIEGFVIQEGAEPFPVSVLCYDNTNYTLKHIYFFMLKCSSLSGLYLI